MKWVGIDFGTTNSVAAILEMGRIQEALDVTGHDPVPTLISFFQEDYRFGFEARADSIDLKGERLIISDLKPNLGRMEVLPVEGVRFHVEDLTTRYLKHLLHLLNLQNEEEIGAVIATPVEYPPSHRHALLRSAYRAGIVQTLFVYEPTAALFQAIHEKPAPEGPVVVLDWGGGTVDLTIVHCHADRRIEDLNVNARRSGLGGRDLDRDLLERHLIRHTDAWTWYSSQSRNIQNRILNNLERQKIAFLSGKPLNATDFSIPRVPSPHNGAYQFHQKLALERLQHFTAEVRGLAVETTRQAGLSVDDVAAFLLVGGPFRSALVRKEFGRVWPNAHELPVAHHQRATVQGCARLAHQGFDLALAADIVVRQFDDTLHHVLLSGQPLPQEKGARRYQEYLYRVTDLAAPQAVLEIGYVTAGDRYVPLEVLAVPVMHERNPDTRSAIPFNVRLQISLDECLYVTARAQGRLMLGLRGDYNDVEQEVGLSRIPLTLIPGANRRIQ